MCHASKERVLMFGTDQRITRSRNGFIERPNTWLHPNASRKRLIFLLHRGWHSASFAAPHKILALSG
jgi:hypothetical protein